MLYRANKCIASSMHSNTFIVSYMNKRVWNNLALRTRYLHTWVSCCLICIYLIVALVGWHFTVTYDGFVTLFIGELYILFFLRHLLFWIMCSCSLHVLHRQRRICNSDHFQTWFRRNHHGILTVASDNSPERVLPDFDLLFSEKLREIFGSEVSSELLYDDIRQKWKHSACGTNYM